VILQKRLLYEAFREVVIPCVAESKGCCCGTIIDHLKVIPTSNVGILGVGEFCCCVGMNCVVVLEWNGMGFNMLHNMGV
jgi:hypothetical protein